MSHLMLKLGSQALCLTLLIYVGYFHYHVHQQVHLAYDPALSVDWEQEVTLSPGQQLLSNKYWQFDSAAIEALLFRISTNKTTGELSINHETRKSLEQIVTRIPKSFSHDEWERLFLIVDKALPEVVSLRLSPLTKQYYFYLDARNTYALRIKKADNNQKIRFLENGREQRQALQRKYFSEDDAHKLFSKENAQLDYFDARRLVNLDLNLTPTDKRQRLESLQKQYKLALKERATSSGVP